MNQFSDYLKLAPNCRTHPAEISLRLSVLERHYNESHRHYHTLAHIEHGYREHARFCGDMNPLMFFAWTYHDAIYNPEASDNEARSAMLFMEDNAVLGFSMAEADRIAMLILSTTHTGEKNLITDIDLSGLGAAPDIYDANTRRIRQEYSFADDAAWRAGRSAFIDRFLATPYIFETPGFVAHYETRARENMVRERGNLT